MSRASLSSILWRGCALLALGSAVGGCGGLSAGDYVFYRIAFSDQEKKSSSCFGDAGIPANTKSDKTTFRSSATFVLYGSDVEGETNFYLDIGAATLEGFEEDDVLTFSGTKTDVEFTEIDGGGDKITTTDKLEIEMVIDGVSLSGSAVGTVKSTCSGGTCDTSLPVPISCTTTQTFVGTEVEDVQLQHDI